MASPFRDRTSFPRSSHRTALALAATMLVPAVAFAQPGDLPMLPAATTTFPPGVTVAKAPAGSVYVDANGRTLYGLDLRTLVRWGPNPALYCADRCAEWAPLLAPADAVVDIAYPQGGGDRLRQSISNATEVRPPAPTPAAPTATPFYRDPLKAPDWTVIAGPAGPQWVYKGWHMVYVRKGVSRASTRYDGAEALTWNTLKFVPGPPTVQAPGGVRAVLANDAYILADKDGHALFTSTCTAACTEWKPLAGGMASAGFGAWKVSLAGDHPQWTYRGRSVFVSDETDPKRVPPATEVLRP